MPTPMFKVLAQSLRLGQPPDATSAVRVLVEAIEKQSAEIEDLRAKLAIAHSRLQYAEARVGRILEAAEPGLARDEAPPSSVQHVDHGHALVATPPGPAQQVAAQQVAAQQVGAEPARGSQRPPPMPGPMPGPGAGSTPTAGRAPSVRPPGIPHALPIPQPPALPQGLTNPHAALHIPQPMPLPPAGGGPGKAALTPSAKAKLIDLVDDAGGDEFNQTLVINKRDVQQLAREAPFPIQPAAERSRANTSGTPFLQPGLQPPPPPAHKPASPARSGPARDERDGEPRPPRASAPPPPKLPRLHDPEPAQDGTKTGIHAHRPAPEIGPSSGGLAPRPGIDPPLAALASANLTDDDDAGSDADFTLTDQTARVDLSGLSELEREAGHAPSSGGLSGGFSGGRAPRDTD